MHNTLIDNGNTTEVVTITSESDIVHYIGKYMGTEFSDCVSQHYSDVINDLTCIIISEEEEKNNYEESLYDRETFLKDCMECLTEINDYIRTAKRMSKDKVLERLENLNRRIYNEL